MVIQFMFLSVNMFWALLGAGGKAKMSLSPTRAQNKFMPTRINFEQGNDGSTISW